MLKSISKKALVTGSLVVLLLVSAYLNYRYNNSGDLDANGWPASIKSTTSPSPSGKLTTSPSPSANTSNTASEDFFASFKSERDDTRDQELAQLDAIITDAKTDDDTLKEAQARKLALVDAMDQTMVVENLIEAKGFTNVAASITPTGATIVVDSTITPEQASQIMDIVKRETSFDAENIKIMSNK